MLPGLVEYRKNVSHVVAIHLEHMPAKSAPLVLGWLAGGHHCSGLVHQLEAIDVDNRSEIIELVLGTQHGGFPDLSFLQFPIAEHYVGMKVAIPQPGPQGHPDAC